MIYGTFEAEMKDATLDSVSSTQIISGLLFQTFTINITLPDKMLLRTVTYNRLFGKKEFSVNITTIDRNKEKELLDSWLNSKFER